MLVTGASAGIGRALAVRAARAGYSVYAVGRNAAALAALAAQVGEEGGELTVDACDISDPANAPGLIGRAIGAYGRLDVLVNNAGLAAVGPLASQTDAELQAQFGTHAIGPIALVREAFAALRASHGHVFMVGSGVARVPIAGMGAYPPSKAAVRSATSILRNELRAFDICVTYVDPGAVDTAFMLRAGMAGAPPRVLVPPELVARKILLATGTRPRVLNVARVSAVAVALADFFPRLTEIFLERNPALTGSAPLSPQPVLAEPKPVEALAPAPAPEPAPLPAPPPIREEPPDEPDPNRMPSPFEAALEPLQRRMERAHLEPAFVRGLLVPDAIIDVAEVAMRWAGMPNKHERALTTEVFFALAEGGFLAPRADGRYRVLRTPD
jgi:short-subunit dehydrogenase